MGISGVVGAASRIADFYQMQRQTDVPRAQLKLEEAFTGKTTAQIQGVGSFCRIYGGARGTLQHIDMTV